MSIIKPTLYLLVGFLLFTFIACKAKQSLVEPPVQDNLDTSKIMILLATNVRPNVLEEAFKTYELKSKGLVSRRENRCIFTYNQSLIDGHSLLEMINKSDKVLEAKFPEVIRQPRVTN